MAALGGITGEVAKGTFAMRRLLLWMAGFPILYKILIANSIIVAVGAVVGTWLTAQHAIDAAGRLRWEWIAPFGIGGLLVSALANLIILKAAFMPLAALERAVDQVRQGSRHVRARKAIFTDPAFDKLTDTLNAMLDTIERYSQQLTAFAQRVVMAQEEERKRIARDLHDDTGQALTSILIRLRVLEKARDAQQIRAGIEELRELTAQAIDNVRRMARQLRPPALDDLGLVATLKDYIRDLASSLNIAIDFQVSDYDLRLPPEVELVIYRVIQEALTNVARHAQATRATVSLTSHNATVIATVEDNGCGFDVKQVLATRDRGLGLFGMQERAALVGGRLHIDSQIGRGTRIVIEVPSSWPGPVQEG